MHTFKSRTPMLITAAIFAIFPVANGVGQSLANAAPQGKEQAYEAKFECRIPDAAAECSVTADQAIPGFSFHPTPGHTVDHASIVLQSGGVEAIFAGDVMHHPVQVIKPELMSLFDPAPERTLASRRWALDFAAERGAIWFSSHFPGSATGRVERAGDGYAWRFV